MAQTPLSEAYRVSGSGFDKKISALVGIGQSIKQSQVAKQKFQQQLDLIEARSEATFERQKRYQEEIVQPAKQQQARQEAILEASEKATENYKELVTDYNSDDLSTARRYNLLNVSFDKSVDEETGIPVTKIYKQTGEEEISEIGWDRYQYEKSEARQRAEWISKIEEGLENGWFPESYPEGEGQYVSPDGTSFKRMTSANANDILKSLRENPYNSLSRVDAEMSRYETPAPYEAPQEGAEGESAKVMKTQELMSDLAYIDEETDDNGLFQIGGSTTDYGSWWNPFDTERVGTKTGIQIKNSVKPVATILEEISNVSSENFGINLTELSKFNKDVRDRILSGETDGLEEDAEAMAESIQAIQEDDMLGEQFKRSWEFYNRMQRAASEWRNKQTQFSYGKVGLDKLFFNWNADSAVNAFIPVNSEDATKRILSKQTEGNYIQNTALSQ